MITNNVTVTSASKTQVSTVCNNRYLIASLTSYNIFETLIFHQTSDITRLFLKMIFALLKIICSNLLLFFFWIWWYFNTFVALAFNYNKSSNVGRKSLMCLSRLKTTSASSASSFSLFIHIINYINSDKFNTFYRETKNVRVNFIADNYVCHNIYHILNLLGTP